MSKQVRRYKNLVALGIDAVKASDYDALHAEAEALWSTYSALVDKLGIDTEKAKTADGKPSDVIVSYVEALRAENGRLRDKYDRDVFGLNNEGDPIGGDPAGGYANDNARLRAELEAARGLLESAVVLFACHCTDATAKNWHDAAAAFLTATPAPEVRTAALYTPQPGQDVRGLVEAAQAFADAARPNIYPCPDKPHSLSGKLQALDDQIAAHRLAQRPGQVNRCPTCTSSCPEICAKARP